MNGSQSSLLFKQLLDYESFTYTYLLADMDTKEAVIIDPVLEKSERDLQLIQELKLKLKYILETHIHADHITSAHDLREKTKAQIALSKASGANGADKLLADGEQLSFGRFTIKAIMTPGHTDGCMCYQLDNKVFTGDTLMIRGTGRTDFQQGSSTKLYNSVREKLFSLPDETLVYPAHDYNGRTVSTIGEEKLHNPRLNLNMSSLQFADIMQKLNLPEPKKLKLALPRNLFCGKAGPESSA